MGSLFSRDPSPQELPEIQQTNDLLPGINGYITILIDDPSINMSLVPDSIERKVYADMFLILTNLLVSNINNMKLTIFGNTFQISATRV